MNHPLLREPRNYQQSEQRERGRTGQNRAPGPLGRDVLTRATGAPGGTRAGQVLTTITPQAAGRLRTRTSMYSDLHELTPRELLLFDRSRSWSRKREEVERRLGWRWRVGEAAHGALRQSPRLLCAHADSLAGPLLKARHEARLQEVDRPAWRRDREAGRGARGWRCGWSRRRRAVRSLGPLLHIPTFVI